MYTAQEISCHTDDSSGGKQSEEEEREEGREAGTILITPNFCKQPAVFIIVMVQIDSSLDVDR